MTVAVPCADGGDIALHLPLAAVACSLIRVLLLLPVPPPPPFPSLHVMSCHLPCSIARCCVSVWHVKEFGCYWSDRQHPLVSVIALVSHLIVSIVYRRECACVCVCVWLCCGTLLYLYTI
jgi:hypothetical protein